MPLANKAPVRDFTPGSFVYGFRSGDLFDSLFNGYDVISTILSGQLLLVNSYKFADGNTEGIDEFSSGYFTIKRGVDLRVTEIRLNTSNLLQQNNSQALINFLNSENKAILFRNGRGQNIGYFLVQEVLLIEDEITVDEELIQISYLKILISATEFISSFENEEIYTLSLDFLAKEFKYINTSLVPQTQGGFFEGEPATPSEGLTIEQFNNKLLFPAILPSISFNASNLTLERGSLYSKVVAINFTQGGAGNLISYSLEKDGAEISTTQITEVTEFDLASNFTLQGKVSHGSGLTIGAGIISTPIVTITQRLRIWFAPLSAIPNTSTDVRGMSSDVFDNANSISLSTGTTHRRFVVAVPTEVTNAASLSAQDVTNNVPYTYDFVNAVNVFLPNFTTEEYRIYALVVDNPYSITANHIIQI